MHVDNTVSAHSAVETTEMLSDAQDWDASSGSPAAASTRTGAALGNAHDGAIALEDLSGPMAGGVQPVHTTLPAAPGRVMYLGDIHGDLEQALKALRLLGAADQVVLGDMGSVNGIGPLLRLGSTSTNVKAVCWFPETIPVDVSGWLLADIHENPLTYMQCMPIMLRTALQIRCIWSFLHKYRINIWGTAIPHILSSGFPIRSDLNYVIL